MIAIIPIFPDHGEHYWTTPEGMDLISKSIQSALKADKIDKLVVFTDRSIIQNFLRSHGIEAYDIKIEPSHEISQVLPVGTGSSVKSFAKFFGSDSEDIAILSFRNPLISTHVLNAAIKKFQSSDLPALMSVKRSLDHPCQLNTYYRFEHFGLLHCFEDNQQSSCYIRMVLDLLNEPTSQAITRDFLEGCLCPNNCFHKDYHQFIKAIKSYRVTKPFFFDWNLRAKRTRVGSGIYVRIYNDFNVQYVPLEDFLKNEHETRPSSLWILDNKHTARILILLDEQVGLLGSSRHPECDSEISGAAFFNDYRTILLRIEKLRHQDKCSLTLNSTILQQDFYTLKFLRITPSGILQDRVENIDINESNKSVAFPLKSAETCGFAYWLLSVVQDDSFDLAEHFNSNLRLWELNTSKNTLINSMTGKAIVGRQDFPEVLEPDGSLFVLSKEMIKSFDQALTDSNVLDYLLNDTNSIHIKSELDIIRARAMSREPYVSAS